MSVLQFSLFFVALLVGYVLVHLRLARFEEHLQKLGGIRSLDDRLKVLVETIEKLRPERFEAQLERLHEDLDDLREATSTVREAVVQIPAAPQAPLPISEAPSAVAPSESAALRVHALVETRLLQLGYRDVQILTDLSGIADHGDADVQIECDQGGMMTKGRVQVRNFGVRDIAMQNVASMFP